MENKKIRVGKIIKPHGLRGEFKIYPYTTDVSAFSSYEEIYIDDVKKFSLEYVKQSKNLLIGKFKEISNINDLPPIIDKDIFIDYSAKRKMEEDEYLISELIGLKVFEEDTYIGEVEDVLIYGANDVFSIKGTNNNIRLIPNVKEFIKKIDLQNERIEVELIEGM